MPIKQVSNTPKTLQFVKSKVSVKSVVIRNDITCHLSGCTLCEAHSQTRHPRPFILLPTPSVLLSYIDILESRVMRSLFTIVLIDSVVDYIKEHRPATRHLIQRLLESENYIRFPDKSCKDTSNGHAVCRTTEQLRDALTISQHYYSAHGQSTSKAACTSCRALILGTKEDCTELTLESVAIPDSQKVKDMLDLSDNTQPVSIGKPPNGCFIAIELSVLFSQDFYACYGSHIEASGIARDTPMPPYEEYHALYLNSVQQTTRDSSMCYVEHLPNDKVETMLSNKQLLTGKVSVFGRGRRGEVVSSYKSTVVSFCSPFFLNRSLHGDRVAIGIVDAELWDCIEMLTSIAPHDIHYDAREYLEKLNLESPGKRVYGIVVAILDRPRHEYCGTIKIPFLPKQLEKVGDQIDFPASIHQEKTVMLRPFRPNLPDFFIKSTCSVDTYIGKRVFFIIEGWGPRDRSPVARISSVLGDVGDQDVEAAVVLFEYDIPHKDLQADNAIMLELRSAGLSGGTYTIPNHVYSSAVTPQPQVDQVDKASDDVLSENIKTIDKYPTARLNLTSEYIVSVDPPSCKDIDDAIHLKVLSPTTFEIGVHIADVSFYVRPESAIDLEARKRGTSVYFPDRRIDMLPSILTEDICSLRSGVDRLATSVLVELEMCKAEDDSGIDAELELELAKAVGLSESEQRLRLAIKKYSFAKTIIRSLASLAYHEAQWLCEMDYASVFNAYEGCEYQHMHSAMRDHINDCFRSEGVKVARVQQNLKILLFLSKILKLERLRNGALILETPAVEFTLDPITKLPTNLHGHVALPTMSMIEELMLLANRLAAEHTLNKYQSIAVLRRHPKPTEDQFLALKTQIKDAFGIELDTTSNKSLSTSIYAAIKSGLVNDKQISIMRQMLTRCMMLAKYFVSSEYTFDEFYHYGLALPIYTHFTSPIRRYSDILVHRLLAAADERDILPVTHSNVQIMNEICANLNLRKESADRASDEADKIFSVLYVIQKWKGSLVQNVPKSAKASEDSRSWATSSAGVLRIAEKSISVILRDYGVEVSIKLQPEEVVARDLNNMWIDIVEAAGPTEEQATLNASNTANGIRRVRVFDEVRVKIGLDFLRIYNFDLHVKIISDQEYV